MGGKKHNNRVTPSSSLQRVTSTMESIPATPTNLLQQVLTAASCPSIDDDDDDTEVFGGDDRRNVVLQSSAVEEHDSYVQEVAWRLAALLGADLKRRDAHLLASIVVQLRHSASTAEPSGNSMSVLKSDTRNALALVSKVQDLLAACEPLTRRSIDDAYDGGTTLTYETLCEEAEISDEEAPKTATDTTTTTPNGKEMAHCCCCPNSHPPISRRRRRVQFNKHNSPLFTPRPKKYGSSSIDDDSPLTMDDHPPLSNRTISTIECTPNRLAAGGNSTSSSSILPHIMLRAHDQEMELLRRRHAQTPVTPVTAMLKAMRGGVDDSDDEEEEDYRQTVTVVEEQKKEIVFHPLAAPHVVRRPSASYNEDSALFAQSTAGHAIDATLVLNVLLVYIACYTIVTYIVTGVKGMLPWA